MWAIYTGRQGAVVRPVEVKDGRVQAEPKDGETYIAASKIEVCANGAALRLNGRNDEANALLAAYKAEKGSAK